VVTEPVQAWANSQVSSLRQLHNTEALKYKATRGYNTPQWQQGHQDTNAAQPAPKPQRLPHSTKATTPQRLPRHKGYKATKGYKNTTKVKHALYETETPERTQTDAPNAMAKNTTKMPKFFSPKFQQSYKSYWGNKGGRTNMRRNTKQLQDLDLARSPHLERDSIGGALDLDLLCPFPQKDARNSGGIKRMVKLFKVNNGGERVGGKN
jgi:hypothetical protein